MIVARGRFDEVKIEALMREHGAHVEDYRGKRMVVADDQRDTADRVLRSPFMEPGLVAVGSTNAGSDGDRSASAAATIRRRAWRASRGNEELMNLVKTLEAGNVWAVGRFDALTLARQPAAPIVPSEFRPSPGSR